MCSAKPILKSHQRIDIWNGGLVWHRQSYGCCFIITVICFEGVGVLLIYCKRFNWIFSKSLRWYEMSFYSDCINHIGLDVSCTRLLLWHLCGLYVGEPSPKSSIIPLCYFCIGVKKGNLCFLWNFCSSLYIGWVIKSEMIRRTYIAHWINQGYYILVAKHQGNGHFGRSRRRWENNNFLRESECVWCAGQNPTAAG